MAAKALTPAEIELVSSLTEDDIPTKLRCAICSKLAVNAYKLPCCEQLIDETCHATLPSTCPVCEHTPLSAADCNPNKVMRSTIRVFIKTELKKRETSRAKQTKEASPVAPVTPVEAPVPSDVSQSAVTDGVAAIAVGETQGAGTLSFSSKTVDNAPSGVEDSQMQDNGHTNANQESVPASQGQGDSSNHTTSIDTDANPATNGTHDISHANSSNGDGSNDTATESGAAETQPVAEDIKNADGDIAMGEASVNGDQPAAEGDASADSGTAPNAEAGEGDDATADSATANDDTGVTPTGAFPNAVGGVGGDLSQMQMMMAMQNGMMPNGFNFPMMGMPGMNMDPSMFMNGMFPGMGMPGANMMPGGYGGAGNGPWNGGHDSFKHPVAGNGDFGSYNAGFQGGFNQQFGYQNQFNNYRGFGRGRGRGRGFYNNNSFGRGGYYNNNNNTVNGGNGFGPHGPNNSMNGNFSHQDQAFGPQQGGRDQDHASSGQQTHGINGNTTTSNNDSNMATDGNDASNGDGATTAAENSQDGAPIPVLETQERDNNGQPGGQGQQGLPFNPRGTNAVPLTTGPPNDVPLNAPSEPKAMRQGLPNTSLLHLRARGMVNDSNRHGSFNGAVNEPGHNSPAAEHSSHGRSRSNSVSTKRRDHDKYRERSRDRSQDRGGRNSHRRNGRSDRHDHQSTHSRKRDRSSERERGRDRDHGHERPHEDVAVPDEKRPSADQDLDYDRHDDWEDGSQGGDFAGDRDMNGYQDGINGRGRSESRSSHGHKRTLSEDSAAAGGDHAEDDGKGGGNGTSSRRRNRNARKRRRRGGDRQADAGGEAVRTRSMSPVDESRRNGGHRSHRDRDTDKTRDRDHRDRDRDRDRGRGRDDDHHRRSRRDEDRDRDREHREHHDRDRDDRRDRDKDKDRSGRNRDRDRDRDRDRGHGRSSGRDKDRGKAADAKGGGADGAAVGGSGDPYAAERERRTRERVAAEAQKRAGISSLAGSKRGRDDFEDGAGGGGGSSGRRNRRRGRRGDGDAERDGQR